MENHLEEVGEHLEHIEEELTSSGFKTVVTALMLLVTAAATTAGVLAARWSADESEAQRARQEFAAQAVAADLHANALQAASGEQADQQSESGWQAAFLRLQRQGADAATAALLGRQADVADRQRAQSTSPVSAQQRTAAAEAQDTAAGMSEAKAQTAADFSAKEAGALTVVSMLAVALFLLGLAPTIGTPVPRRIFVALAALGLVVAVGRLSIVATRHTQVPTAQCVQQYAAARQATTTYEAEISRLHPVVHDCTRYADAYEALGDAESGIGTPRTFLTAEADYRTALRQHPAYAAILYNNLATAQLFDHHLAAARTSLQHAAALDPNNEITLGSEAEQRAFSGDQSGADRYLAQALALVAKHGPYFRDSYFASLRTDALETHVLNIATPTTNAFYRRVDEAEASLDVYGRPAPGDAHGATVDHIVARKAPGKIGAAGTAMVTYTLHGLRPGDHLSVRWYLSGVTFSLEQSEVDAHVTTNLDGRLQPGAYVVPTAPGTWTVEVYVNGNLAGSTTFTMPNDQQN